MQNTMKQYDDQLWAIEEMWHRLKPMQNTMKQYDDQLW